MKTRPLIITPTTASLPLACAVLALGFAYSGHAATSTWTSTTAASWSTAGSWDNGVPTSTVDAILKATSGNVPTIAAVSGANMATLTLDGPSAAANVLNYGGSTPLVQNMYGQTSKPLISITSNANSAVSFTKVEFKIRVNGELDIATGKTLTLANSYISQNSTGLKLTKTGGGTLAFTGSSTTKITFTGGLDMQEGTWIASQNASALPSSGLVNFTNASGTNAKITVSADASIEALGGGNANSTIDGTKILTVTGAQNTTYDGTIGGSVALKHTGSGSLALTRASTYTGATTVNGGKLVMGDGATDTFATSGVTVTAGTANEVPVATLAGNGSIGGTVALAAESVSGFKNGGVLAPTAAASGTKLSVTGTTSFGAGSIFEWNMSATNPAIDPVVDLNSGSYGQLAGTGTISGGDAVFKIVLGAGNAFSNAFWDSDKSWDNVFTGAGASTNLASIFSSMSGTGITYGSGQGTVAGEGYFTFNGTSTLNWTAVPEPTSALAGLLITAGLLRRRRREAF